MWEITAQKVWWIELLANKCLHTGCSSTTFGADLHQKELTGV